MDNSIKQELQEEALSALDHKKRVVLKWATGCGKSRMTIELLNSAMKGLISKDKPFARILLVVAERSHFKNWEDEFKKWGLNTSIIHVDIICYASLHKVQNGTYDAVVFDEGHHAFTDKRMALIETLKSKYTYILSATLPSSKIERMEEIFGKFTISTVTLKDAIGKDILPDPKIYAIEMELDAVRPNQLIKIGKKNDYAPVVNWEDRNKYIYKNIPCQIKCTERQKYDYYTSTMEYWKQRYEMSHNEYQRNLWVSTGSLRKRFLGELKTILLKAFTGLIPEDRRYVCFCASVNQANYLSGKNTISSRKPSKANQAIIDSFNNKKINNLFAVGMITEGINLNGIETGIIIQLDGKERLFVQKIGRALRADSPVVYIFYYKNTQDEKYLENALEQIDEKYVKRISINQLTSTLK